MPPVMSDSTTVPLALSNTPYAACKIVVPLDTDPLNVTSVVSFVVVVVVTVGALMVAVGVAQAVFAMVFPSAIASVHNP
ncbi:hypothetical protein HN371_07035 [Candidatus Poribacteria bacterium]|nr:hypothetical protein [Candidatus Poribacteria bacterium]MBT5531435.1 hypothetical protein [Candidatus Poribacteria bacterium]MBT5714625.1 hypothetical protein [Candidatus Poribacteria bacterium]MBT7805144.1 hypothetical protein [Candidatus Poribacteria bacterium]